MIYVTLVQTIGVLTHLFKKTQFGRLQLIYYRKEKPWARGCSARLEIRQCNDCSWLNTPPE